jgi:hypothetical protein
MIPFDLAQFDEDETSNRTATSIESIAKGFLDNAGLEREGAALLLSRLYIRKDTTAQFQRFLNDSEELSAKTDGPFKVGVSPISNIFNVL